MFTHSTTSKSHQKSAAKPFFAQSERSMGTQFFNPLPAVQTKQESESENSEGLPISPPLALGCATSTGDDRSPATGDNANRSSAPTTSVTLQPKRSVHANSDSGCQATSSGPTPRSGKVQRQTETSPRLEDEEKILQPQLLQPAIQRACAACEEEPEGSPVVQPMVQPKLSVGDANDVYEQEADRVADHVVNHLQTAKAHSIQTKLEIMPPRITPLAMRNGQGSADASGPVEQGINNHRGAGLAIAPALKVSMENAFGADFSGVRLHTGGDADSLNRSLNARAFTTGQDIFFKSGEYQPDSTDGQRLLAHELTHVLQQDGVSTPTDTTINRSRHQNVFPGSSWSESPDTPMPPIISRPAQTSHFESKSTRIIQRQSWPSFDMSSATEDTDENRVMRKVDAQAVESPTQTHAVVSERGLCTLHGTPSAHGPTNIRHPISSPSLQRKSDDMIQRQADITKAPPGLPCILKTGPGHSLGIDVLFSMGKSSISPADKSGLASFATTWIASGAKDSVFVDGFASTDGAQATNWRLSCERAEAVRTELVTNGVSSAKIVVIAHGESTEFSTSDEKENRRAVVSSLSIPAPPAVPPAVPPQPAPLALKSIKFSSDHGLKDNNSNWSSSGSVIEPEWVSNPLRNKSISQKKSTRLVAEITVNFGSPGATFDLIGTGLENSDTSFRKTGIVSTGADQVVTITADSQLPDAVSHLTRYIVWKVKAGNKEQLAGFSGPHNVYVTYGTPIGVATEKRMAWSCTKASGESTPAGIADKIQAGVSSETSFGGAGTDGWNLLAGGSGDCDNQARLMKKVVNLLGVAPATVEFVRASTNAGAGNCLDLESKWWFGTQYLIMDFDTGPGHNWNAYEGCCKTAGSFYAITPQIKASDDYDMLKKIHCEQFWVASPVPPGMSGWGVTAKFSLQPKP